jgi:uncharacterized protein YukE
MQRYIAASNAALRLRAMWDKLLGLRILLYWPNQYQKFSAAKSRLKEFKKIAKAWKRDSSNGQDESIEEWNKNWEQSINQIDSTIRKIDDDFRTAEAHSVGRISKWAFVKQEDEDDPFTILLMASNDIYKYLGELSFDLLARIARK